MEFIAGYGNTYGRTVCIRTTDESQVWEWLDEQLCETADQILSVELEDDEERGQGGYGIEQWDESAALAGFAEAARSAAKVAAGDTVLEPGPSENADSLRSTLHNTGTYRIRQDYPEERIWWVATE